MTRALRSTYGESAVQWQQYTPQELQIISDFTDGEPLVIWTDGFKFPFGEIFQRYNNILPEKYKYVRVGNSYKNNFGFQLLKKDEYADDIHNFYDVVREYFCNIPAYGETNYIRDLKIEYSGQNWEEFGSMAWDSNFQISDTLKFLDYMINETDDHSNLRRLIQHYVDLFSVEYNCFI